jgi:predicted DNA-binding transcriptional regulator AlpA
MAADTIPLRVTDPPAPNPDSQAAGSPPPLLFDTADLCQLLRISKATLHRLLAASKLPRPIRLAGLKWPAADIEAFVAMGCPDRATFEARRDAESARNRR